LVGAGAAIVIILSVFSSFKPVTAPGLLVVSTYLLPTVATILASVFVYRHTARRRRLQAALTAIIALLLTILFFVLASIVTARSRPIQPQPSRSTISAEAFVGFRNAGRNLLQPNLGLHRTQSVDNKTNVLIRSTPSSAIPWRMSSLFTSVRTPCL